MSLTLPDDGERITIIGKTGSGKTQGAAWLLANRSYTEKPWIVFNWKYDQLLDDIPGAKVISVTDAVPKKPGVYLVHPHPGQEDAVEALMWRIWQRENVGVFIDEGYMISARSAAYQAILTQGRSKRIPTITLTQRPSWLTRFAFSEADYIQLYQLTDRRDAKTVREFMPLPIENRLPAPYWSWWWDNGRNYAAALKPVPKRDIILQRFKSRLIKPRRVL